MFWVQGPRIPWVTDNMYMTKSALMWVFNSSIGIGEAVSLTDSNELMEVAGFEAMREWPLRVFGFGLRTVLCVFLV
ncbi:hypothetical protein Bca4012_090075 [Brassica carinata]